MAFFNGHRNKMDGGDGFELQIGQKLSTRGDSFQAAWSNKAKEEVAVPFKRMTIEI